MAAVVAKVVNNNLKTKTILGFVLLIGGLGILLFAPAWTLDYWQAWVYLGIFVASEALIAGIYGKKIRSSWSAG